MNTKPPYLAAAFFCENVLTEQDGVASAIRIVDRLFIPKLSPAKPAEGTATPAALINLFISLKGGGYSGKGQVKFVPVTPSGKSLTPQEMEIEFPKEPNAGANIVVRTAIAFKEEGVYWFEIYFNGELVTRTPLDVQLMTAEMLQSLPGAATQKPK